MPGKKIEFHEGNTEIMEKQNYFEGINNATMLLLY
jgi:hypothetical protein